MEEKFVVAAKRIFLTTLGVIMVCLLAIGLIFGSSSTVSADSVKDKVENETYIDYIRNTATTEVVGDFTKYFLPDTKTVEIYDDKLKPMLNMTWLTDYEEKVSSGSETEVACTRIDYIDDKVLPVFNQIKSYDKKNSYDEIDKDFSMKINNGTNESKSVCYEYDNIELIEINSLIDVKYFPQDVCWYTDTKDGDNIEFVIGNGDFWLVEFASFLVDDLVAYYKLDETSGTTSADVHGSLGLTEVGTSSVPGSTGIIDKAWDFAGDMDHLASSANTGISGTASRSVSVWAKYDADGQGSNLFGMGTGSTGKEFSMGRTASNAPYFTGYGADFTGTGTITGTGWHHHVVTYDGTTVRLYVDGATAGTGTPSLSTTNAPMRIGTRAGAGGHNGLIDEVGLWSRVLTPAEVTELFGVGSPPAYPFEGPQCEFSGFVFDEQDNTLEGANVTIWNQFDVTEFYEVTTDVNGLWGVNISNSTNTYMAGAYFNNTIIGQLKPYISGTC